jgi:hypothetical protein
MELIEKIGAVLGLAAFLGLAVLSLLYFQQARDVKRLRQWAGKAPERAAAAAQEAGVELPRDERGSGFISRLFAPVGRLLSAIGRPIAGAWSEFDRRSPIDPRLILAGLALGAIAAVIFVVHPFGLLEDEPTTGGDEKSKQAALTPSEIEVAVLNGTAVGPAPEPGLADEVGRQVQAAGYRLGDVGDTGTPFAESVIMYARTEQEVGEQVAADLGPELGDPPLEVMTNEISELAGNALVAVVAGEDAGGG